jgi:single-strand DNA-binding protein
MTIRVTAEVGVAADMDLKFSNGGKAWTSLRCVSNPRKQVNGQWVDGEPTWLNVVVFGKSAEMLAESGVGKGSRLIVTGRIENRAWTDKEGTQRYSLEITADKVGLDTTFTAYTKVDSHRAERGSAQRAQSSAEREYDPWNDGSAPF